MRKRKDGYMKDFSRQPELLNLSEVGIYDETDKLRKAAIWGEVGAEIVLTQLYPPHISLFHGEMDIPKAREEVNNFAETLMRSGIKVVQIRDSLAEILNPQKSLTVDKLLQGFVVKMKKSKLRYGNKELDNGHIEIIDWLVKEDIAKYGKSRALTLNWTLSIRPDLPLGNSIYAKDQMSVILGKMIRSSMKEPIRQPETALYNRVYRELGFKNGIVDIPNSETFEGGDAFVHAKTVYIGVGTRTSIGAAKYIYEALKQDMIEYGYKFVVIEEEESQARSHHDEMSFMHLDTFFNPVGENEVVICDKEASKKTVRVFTTDDKGSTQIIPKERSFIKYLEDENQQIIRVPLPEQQNFGCNFLTISENTVIVPDIENIQTIEELKKVGKQVIRVPLAESTEGYGSAHCMVGQLFRG